MSYSPFRHIGSVLWKRHPVQLTFFVTRKCNAQCPFCFYLSKKDNGKDRPELTLEEIRKISKSTGNLLWLAFSGGEIFLREDLFDIVNIMYENSKPAIILLPTNGLLPHVIREKTETILQRCEKSIVTVKLSLDGPEALHDSLRGTDGAFQKTMETLALLGDLQNNYPNLELGINTLFCSANQDVMDEVLDLVNGLEYVNTHTVSLIRGDVNDEGLKRVDMDKYKRTVEKMETQFRNGTASMYRFRGARLKAAQDNLQRRFIYNTARQDRSLVPCYAGRLNLVLTETGDVYPCESFRNTLGNIRESGYDIQTLLKSREARQVVRSIRNNACHCTHECYMMTNILFNPVHYPALLKEYLRP